MSRPALLALLFAATACSPHLRQVKRTHLPLGSTEDCVQRLELRRETLGGDWGEYVQLWVSSPQALHGQVRLTVDGKVLRTASWRTGVNVPGERNTTTYRPDPRPANQRCVQRPGAGSASGSGPSIEVHLHPAGGSLQAQLPQPPPPAAPPPATAAPPEPAPAVQDLAPVSLEDAQLLAVERAGRGGPHAVYILRWEVRHQSLEPYRGRPGLPLLIELWSEEPNDLERVVFVLEQGTFAPSSSEEEWKAELRKRESDRVRKAHRHQVEARRKRERAKSKPVKAQVRRAPPQKFRELPAPAPPQVVQAPRPGPPPGPPPAPRHEVYPRPSPYVQWVQGYWHWSGFEWVWLHGWWKVDERARLLVEAKVAVPAPAPRVEPQAQEPFAGAVWRVGLWLWTGTRWHWEPGGWGAQTPHPASPVPSQEPR